MVLAGAYLATSLISLAVIITLRRAAAPELLQSVLGFVFIAGLAAGLEPATVKASALLKGRGDDAAPPAAVGACLAVSALKGALASPILALIWRFADPHIPALTLAWLPAVCIAGFMATDLRVFFDLEGRHARAVWLKQGSLSGGLVMLASLVLLGVSLFWAIGVSTLARLVVVGIAALATLSRSKAAARPLWSDARRLLGDVRWMELAAASVIAAISGGTDRVVGLRYLPAAEWGSYYLLYEVFSKFWFIPYVLSPVIFARRAGGEESGGFIRGAWGLIAVTGALFLAGVAGALTLAPSLVQRFIGMSLPAPILAFAAAVVISSFTQLRLAELQGSGAARRVVVVMGASAMVSAVLFFVFVRQFGATGLLFAWLIKSLVDFAATMVGGRRGLVRQSV